MCEMRFEFTFCVNKWIASKETMKKRADSGLNKKLKWRRREKKRCSNVTLSTCVSLMLFFSFLLLRPVPFIMANTDPENMKMLFLCLIFRDRENKKSMYISLALCMTLCSSLCCQRISLLFLWTTTCFTFGPFSNVNASELCKHAFEQIDPFFSLGWERETRERERESAMMPLRWPRQTNDTCFRTCCNFFQIYLSCIQFLFLLGRRRQQCAAFGLYRHCLLIALPLCSDACALAHSDPNEYFKSTNHTILRWFQCFATTNVIQMKTEWICQRMNMICLKFPRTFHRSWMLTEANYLAKIECDWKKTSWIFDWNASIAFSHWDKIWMKDAIDAM